MQSTVNVPRPITILLLVCVIVAILAVTMWTSGANYSQLDPIPFEDLRHLAHRIARHPVSMRVIALIIVPIIANILLFVPFGFFLFITLYSIERPTVQTYVLTTFAGLTFSCLIEAWQYFLPSRVADVNDIIWNCAGALAGAILAHLRMRVRIEFD
ncbi:MAG TPA: VanZ family protein [Thermoanaerobaculia bacterium]|nr:VanZ family protein [Thermoanaerobaculia bacterium]